MYNHVRLMWAFAVIFLSVLLGCDSAIYAQDDLKGGTGTFKPAPTKVIRKNTAKPKSNRKRMSESKSDATVVNGISGKMVATNFAGDQITILGFDPPINTRAGSVRGVSELKVNIAYKYQSSNSAVVVLVPYFKGKDLDDEVEPCSEISKGAGNIICSMDLGQQPIDGIIISISTTCMGSDKRCEPQVVLTLDLNLKTK